MIRFARTACLAVALACLGCVAGQPTVPTPSPAASATAANQLAGRVTLPVLALSQGGIIPTGIGAVIAAGGGDLPTSRQRQLLLVATEFDERPVSGALVVALDATTLAQIPGTAAVKSDADGTYKLDVPPGDRNVVVEAVFRSPDGTRAFRLLGAAKPGAPANVSFASTAAVASVLDAGGHARPDLATTDLAPLQAAATARVAGRTTVDAAALYTRTLGIDPAAIPAAVATVIGLVGSPPPDVTLPLPSPSPAPSAVTGAIKDATQPVASALSTVTQPVASALGTVTQPVASTAASLVNTVTQPVTSTTQAVTNAVIPAPVASVAASVPQTVNNVVHSILPSPLLKL